MALARISFILASGLLALLVSHQAAAIRINGEASRATKATTLTLRSSNYPEGSVAKMGFRELPIERIIAVQDRNKANAGSNSKEVQIGIGRLTSSEAIQKQLSVLQWQLLKTGKVARFEVTSPDALATRIGLRIHGLDDRAELRFSGSDNAEKIEAVVSGADAKRLLDSELTFWTPVTQGEKQMVEIFLPLNAQARDVRFNISAVMHLLVTPKDNFALEKAFGTSDSCEINTVCSIASLGQNYVNAKNAVALMVYTKPGFTYYCTGTLLNDNVAASQIPYFLTANHCISTQALANTLTTFWNDESTTCNTTSATSPTQLVGGATLLYSQAGGSVGSNSGTDLAFLRLNNAPPALAFFAGWDASILTNNTAVTAIHHPAGDVKKVSQGNKYSSTSNTHLVSWSSATTEQGSSGSGLFSFNANGYYLRGGLFGGSANCANSGSTPANGNSDVYSRFDVAFPNLTTWLTPASNSGPTVSHSGSWWNPAEGGWGVTWFEYPSNGHFGLMFIYDATGSADWYELSGNWTGSDFHSGKVKRVGGPPFSTTYNSAVVNKTDVGTYTMDFSSGAAGSFSYTINGVTRSNNPLIKTCCLSTDTTARSGSWWNPAEGGWGLTWFDYPSNGHFGLMFTYNTTGRADWYELSGTWNAGNTIHSGNVLRVSGPAFGPTFNSAVVSKATVGTYSMNFSSNAAGNFTYTINGITRTNNPEVKTCCITQ